MIQDNESNGFVFSGNIVLDRTASRDVISLTDPHMWIMEQIDFGAPADVFSVGGRRGGRNPVTYRRFPTCAEAVRHAIEVLGADALRSAVVETNEARLSAGQIRALYERSDYPLPRRKTS